MKKFLLLLLLAISFYVVKTLYQAGQFKSIEDHFEGTVTTIYKNMPGPEDMQVDYETGLMFISAAIRRFDIPNQQKEGIYLLDLTTDSQPRLLPSTYAGDFSPHGISLLRADSSLYIFVVNHNSEGDFIESFLYENGGLTHLKSYSDPMMCCPNDVVATAMDKFYVTNDHGTKSGFMRTVEDYGRIPRSSVLYFDGNAFSKVSKPYLYANGINISNDGKRLYLAATTGASLIVFDIAEDNSLTKINTIDLGTGVDNIDVDEEGNLWIGCHPKLLAFVGHVKDSTKLSPSQILKLTPLADDEFKVEEVYLNSGLEVSGSSTGLFYKDELFIGVVLDHTLLRATYKNKL